ncbi:hypothetical protein A9404_10810 [Halothiobacillus diazotrophicus]|uniref:Uncharacterized protein n=1 Tax=Halothiobacillus diazotrophicus TaxID=1860122 RepID=A0A191ZIX8_9GAMM|nr:hypothetical protein [Halothiobacillus diazotrophicus]ANJ67802.1 hypothetical protein A9404_10810 [Halothiobacillus diazotrophicus]
MSDLDSDQPLVYRHGRGSDAAHRRDAALYARLLEDHAALKRESEPLPNGIRAWTTSENPELVRVLQAHVTGMEERFAQGRAIRSWDPLFSALFEYRDALTVTYRNLPDGVETVMTADDPKLVELIQCNDVTLHQFVRHGAEASKHRSPVPDWVLAAYGEAPPGD